MAEQIVLEKKNLTKLPALLRDLRKQKNVKQTDVAEKMQVLQSHVCTMENKSKKKIPQIPTLVKYLQAIGCKLAIIVD